MTSLLMSLNVKCLRNLCLESIGNIFCNKKNVHNINKLFYCIDMPEPSSVIVPRGVCGFRKCLWQLDYLITRYLPNFYIVSEHGEHIHVSHICPYSGGTCRCSFFLWGIFWNRDGRHRLRRITRDIELGVNDWRHILRYLSTGGRRVHSEDVQLFNWYKYLSVRVTSIYVLKLRYNYLNRTKNLYNKIVGFNMIKYSKLVLGTSIWPEWSNRYITN